MVRRDKCGADLAFILVKLFTVFCSADSILFSHGQRRCARGGVYIHDTCVCVCIVCVCVGGGGGGAGIGEGGIMGR